MKNYPEIKSVLYSEEQIQKRVGKVATEIRTAYQDEGKFSTASPNSESLLVVGVLKGALYFFADLTRELKLPLSMDFMQVASYGDETVSGGDVRIVTDLHTDVKDRDVLIVEDIVDTGRTLEFLVNTMTERGARSVKTCTMLDKPSRRVIDIKADFVGFTVDNVYVVGYGMDIAQKYRELPFIGYF